MRLDHLAIAAETLAEGVAWAEGRFGVAFQTGGKHERFGTHNSLLGLADNIYVEVIAPDPDADCTGARWFGLDSFTGPPRLANWICATDDIETLMVHGMRKVTMSRGDLSWDIGVPVDGNLPMGGGFPTVLQWHTDLPPARRLAPSGCALRWMTVNHPAADDIAVQLTGTLVDPRIRFVKAPEFSLSAQIETPRGRVTL